MATSPQRQYRAACPNCGAPVEFASAASASAVCGFCRSTLVREGQALRRIGTSAELFDDHSPLQLGVRGTRQGMGFTLVGRLQYSYEGGTWNEWHALFDNERSAWLSEDNGAYVLAFDMPRPADLPALASLRVGQTVVADGRPWSVASITQARLLAAQGELPSAPHLDTAFTVVDLRNAAGEVATLDARDAQNIGWSVGRAVLFSELALSGLKETSEKTLGSRATQCPSCGAALAPKLSTTKSLTCGQCQAVVDISGGVGADLAHYAQNNAGTQGAEPLIALGKTGPLALGGPLAPWQVVGYLERCDNPDSAEEETSYWREYLLYNQTLGFAFLVDTNEGWSWVRPITGAPRVRGEQAEWQGVNYRKRWDYSASVTWVQGEFYWRVNQGERARVTDYEGQGAQAAKRLSREQVAGEVTWSAGETLSAAVIASAFGIAPGARVTLERDAAPLASSSGLGFGKGVLLFVVIVLMILLMSRCESDDCAEVRSTFGEASQEYQQCKQRSGSGYRGSGGGGGGGSYGGWSGGGGGHK